MSWALWVATASAHVPNIASYNLDSQDGHNVLRISLPSDGMHQALKLEHPDLELSQLDTQAYQALLSQTLLDGIALELDGQDAPVDRCVVSLAPHQTQVLCAVAGPSPSTQVQARIDALSAQTGQNNVLRVLTHPQAGHVVLKDANDFQGSIQLAQPVSQEPDPEQGWPWAWGSLLLFPVFLTALTLSSRPTTAGTQT